jgi:hypothetical protein
MSLQLASKLTECLHRCGLEVGGLGEETGHGIRLPRRGLGMAQGSASEAHSPLLLLSRTLDVDPGLGFADAGVPGQACIARVATSGVRRPAQGMSL